jgi:hypothetical protein
MRKTLSKPETHIVMRVGRQAGVINLRVFAANLRLEKTTIVGTANIRVQDLREVVSLLNQQLQFGDLLARQGRTSSRKSKKMKRKTAARGSGVGRSVKSTTPQQYIEALDRAGLIDLIKQEIISGQ